MRRRGLSLVELLVAALIIGIAAAGALATWTRMARIPASKRATDLTSQIATHVMEKIKARKYLNLTDTTFSGGSYVLVDWNSPSGSPYFDKFGDAAGSAQPKGYRVKYRVYPIWSRDATRNTEDLVEVEVHVMDNSATRTYEVQRTLISFGGI